MNKKTISCINCKHGVLTTDDDGKNEIMKCEIKLSVNVDNCPNFKHNTFHEICNLMIMDWD